MGLIKIADFPFLLTVKSAEIVTSIDNQTIYKVKEIEFFHTHIELHSHENLEIDSFILGLKKLISLGFFFSFTYHLTHTRQRISKIPSNCSIISKAEEKYFWNYYLYSEFRENQVEDIFQVVMICGYVGSISEELNDKDNGNNNKNNSSNSTIQSLPNAKKKQLKEEKNTVTVTLISRRSINHAGTRYLTRGINDDGYVANYVETEQILTYYDHMLSFTQIRGSAPVFFSQLGVTAQTTINRSPEMMSPAFIKHIKEAMQGYNMMFMINLMNAFKPGEQIITNNIEKQISLCEIKNLRYLFFDFQTQTKYENYDKLESFTSENYLKEILDFFKFFCEDLSTGSIIKEQLGIIRTNCLDCLDRTNIIQIRIAWRVLEIQLAFLNFNVEALFGNIFLNSKNPHPLLDKFKTLWAEMGDFISIQYAGSASTITSITKHGKHGVFGLFQHGLATITRFYQGSFEDSFKQKCIELLLQYQQKNFNFTSPYIEEELKKQESRYKKYSNLKLYFANWNVGARDTKGLDDLKNWLNNFSKIRVKSNINNDNDLNINNNVSNISSFNYNKVINNTYDNESNENSPDVFIIGFQEIVDLNANNMFITSNVDITKSWKKIIKKTLESIDKYSLLKTLDLVGLYVIVLIKTNLRENIKYLDSSIIRTGMLGTVGNKGSLIIKFNYNDSSFVFVCSHLTHGLSGNKYRINELQEILSKTFMNNSKEMQIRNFDYVFIFGDLNFRIDYDDIKIRQLISVGKHDDLYKYDQLLGILNSNLFSELTEEKLEFDPTYKYTIGTSVYDTAKKRAPAWCDRIIYNKSNKINCLKYDSVNEYTQSDHKPIYGIYNVVVSSINFKEKEKLILEIKKNQKHDSKYFQGTDIFSKLSYLIYLIYF